MKNEPLAKGAGDHAPPGGAAAGGVKQWVGVALRFALFPVVFLWPAGTWRWWEAWAVVGLYIGYGAVSAVFLMRSDPALLRERLRASPTQAGQKTWDKVLMIVMFIAGFGIFIVPGLDVVRYGWSEPLPRAAEIIAMAIHIPCFWALLRVMRANTFLARVVKIDAAREHHVITTGPYAVVRHPMYAAVIPIILAMPIALGSRWGLVPAGLMVAILLVRTALEDRTLHRELPGYPEYAEKTRSRLVPGIW